MTPLPHHEKKEDDSGLKLSKDLLDALAKFQEIELEDFQLDVGELEIRFDAGAAGIMPQLKLPGLKAAKPTSMLQAAFMPPVQSYPGKIAELS